MAKLPKLTSRDWFAAGIVFFTYIGIHALSVTYVREPILLYIPSAVAMSVFFFSGIRLWPAVLLAVVLSGIFIIKLSLVLLVLLPITEVLKVTIGAYLLREARIDPLFRKFRDMFFMIVVVFLTSLLTPTVNVLASWLIERPTSLEQWGERYAAAVLTLLVLLPFLLRWFAKRRFSRNLLEVAEIALVFTLLTGLSIAFFVMGIDRVGGIQLVYFMLIPLFWIALRLRPRFVTLALLTVSSIALGNILITETDLAIRGALLFEMEVFLITLSTLFLLIVSLEEDRRLNVNLMRSQLATLENAVSRISSESKAKNDFIAVLAHELRNPLAPIVSGIDLLRITGTRTKDEEETLDIMEDRMQTVKHLLDDLLDISRIAEHKLTLKKEPVELRTSLKRAIISTEHHFKDRHQQLTYKEPPKPLMVLGDPVRLEQIFSNLLTNASKYSDPGDPVTMTVKKTDSYVEVTVTDKGVGIKEDSLRTIFTPFHQIEQGERSIKGLGIGLALVQNFVELHGGSVTATSKGPGHGSQFSVVLPLMLDENAPAPVAKLLPPQAPTIPDGKPSVLIVDDNDAAAWSIGKLLELQGCLVSYAYDGDQAVERVAMLSPHVVLLDVGLPDKDGYMVAKILRTQGYTGKLVALTGFSTEEARQKGASAGFDDFVVKPATQAELRTVIPGLS